MKQLFIKFSKSRRSFLRSFGILMAGLGFPGAPSLSGSGRKISIGGVNISVPGDGYSDDIAVKLPSGIRAVWDLNKAFRDATPTREKICINGLWLWQPGTLNDTDPPTGNWGYFKVPGPWPGVSGYEQKDSQTVFPHPAWKNSSPERLITAWYQREIRIPEEWHGRRITVSAEYLNSLATVFVDRKNAGSIRFPEGQVDLTDLCKPGSRHTLSLKVTALPLQDVLLSFSDTNAAYRIKGSVARRGLCGDVFLSGIPAGPSITDIRINTSYRNGEIRIQALLENIPASDSYSLVAEVIDRGSKVVEFRQRFSSKDLDDSRLVMIKKWKPEKLWDIHTPENQYDIVLSILDRQNTNLDISSPVRFGYRELWIEGRDFYLNGSRIFLSAIPIDNAQAPPAFATYEAVKESIYRLQGIGFNFVFTHNYGCQPGTHLSFAELLRAADDTGMLVSFSQPHFGHYNWKDTDADEKNGYAAHAEFYVKMAQNHPSVVFYSTSHNSTGYAEDMNPDMIDGFTDREQWGGNNLKLARRVEAILQRLDPYKIIYHHSSGNLGSMHTSNFYTNWAPVQEKCDWLGHWSTKGVKPFFTCEYSDPSTWDWTMYRGWYKGERAFGGAKVPWEFCIAEWNSQLLGDKAFRLSEEEKKNLRWEAEQFRQGKIWGRFEYPYHLDYKLPERYPVFARSIADSWRASRAWEISASSQWEYSNFMRPAKGVSTGVMELPVDWDNLQKPGFSADRIDQGNPKLEYHFGRADWISSEASDALIKNNQPLLAYIGGNPERFTSKDHNFLAGESFEKQLIIINNSRHTVSCECNWSLNIPGVLSGSINVSIETGQQQRIPMKFCLPSGLKPGNYEINAGVSFSRGETQTDSFRINVVRKAPAIKKPAKLAVWDPPGETAGMLTGLGIRFTRIEEGADLSSFQTLIVGKGALTAEGQGLNLEPVRKGLKVIVFEQKSEVLEGRLGFRVQEYGLRNVFIRVPDHPFLSGIGEENLHDWRGEATILPPRLRYELSRHFGSPTVKWCGIPVPRQWRCGNQGNIASVLIEKPARGNFLPVLDGGFSLQYSPLMEYREGKGLIVFCQMDVTGRTEYEPVAEKLTFNLLSYVSGWKPGPVRQAVYMGADAGKDHLDKAGIPVNIYSGGDLTPGQVLIAGPGSGPQLSAHARPVNQWLKNGGNMLLAGLGESEIQAVFPSVRMKKEEHISAYFQTPGMNSLLEGIGPADTHNRAPGEIFLVSEGASVIGNGVLAKAGDVNAVFYQLVPWNMDYSNGQHNIKQSFRRSSFLFNRLLGNMGVSSNIRLLDRFNSPVIKEKDEKRWLDDLYLDEPEEWDDPYRFFRW